MKFPFNFSDILQYNSTDSLQKEAIKNFLKFTDSVIAPSLYYGISSLDYNYESLFVLLRLEDLFAKHKLIERLSSICLDMFNDKVDSESMEITNFFSYLIDKNKDEVTEYFETNQFNLTNFFNSEKKIALVRNPESLISEKLSVGKLSDITEGYINSTYITAGYTKELIFYLPKNSLFHFSGTISYYDALIHIYKYIPVKDPRNKPCESNFALVAKEQKIESDFTPFEINIYAYKPEVYKIVFDNSFSWMNGKEFKYKTSILSLSQGIRASDNHKLDLRYKLECFRENVLHKITDFVFFKFESFLGKEMDKYGKKTLTLNYMHSRSFYTVQGILSLSNSSKPKEIPSKSLNVFENEKNSDAEIASEKEELDGIKLRNERYSKHINSYTRGRRELKIAKLASIDVILKGYIKNVIVRVNLNETELEDPDFIKEIQRFEDESEGYIFFSYYYLRQNKALSLGSLFEQETKYNSNIIFMTFPIAESCIKYYLYDLVVNNEKLPEKVIYFHFDKSIDKYNYAFYSDGDIISDDNVFGEEGSDTPFEKLIVKIIDTVNFNVVLKKQKKDKTKKDDSDDEDEDDSDDDEDEEKTAKLKNWKIVCSFTGGNEFPTSGKAKVKEEVKKINAKYFEEGKTKKEKKIKTVFKSLDFIEEMTNFMHCFELH